MIATYECDYDSLLEKKTVEPGPMFYVEPLDKVIGGMPKRLAVIGGFSSSYKTTLSLNVMYNNAIELGYNCGILSLEMEKEDILLRLLVRHSHHPKFSRKNCIIKLDDIKFNKLSEFQKEFLLKIVAHDLKNNQAQIVIFGPDDILETFGSSSDISAFKTIVSKMEQRLEFHKKKVVPKLHLIVIDYIQLFSRLLRNQFKGLDQFQIVAQIIRYLKLLTQSYDNRGITIVVLSQLNRASFSSIKERLRNPKITENDKYKNIYDLTSISESSEIVNAADHVVTIYTDDKLKKDHVAIVQLLKNRFGDTLEEGQKIMALPDIAYIGDTKDDRLLCDQEFISSLIMGLK